MTSLLRLCQRMFFFGCIFFFFEDYLVIAGQNIYDVTCYHKYDKGVTYNGTVNVTVDGSPCKNWKMYHSQYANYSEDNNYCRNPRPDTFNKTWCYTGDKYVVGLCNIPACDCRNSTNDLHYNGTINISRHGKTCNRWINIPSRYPNERENYCRTPLYDSDNAGGPWCYVNSTDISWERCNIPICGGAECPVFVDNLETLDRKTRYHYGESVILNCKSGYILIGQKLLTCLQSGQWNDTIPRCEDVDECSSNPCKNGGTCTDRVNGYTCRCRDNYFGASCQDDIRKCHYTTCRNRGICKEGLNGTHVCICPRGYTGESCEQEPNFKVPPQILLLNSKITIPEGTSNSSIPCFAEGIPLPSIKWESIDKTSLPSNARQVVDYLIFENVTMADSGLYMCTAKNDIGTDVKVLHLIVKAKPALLHTGPVIHAISTVKVDYYTDAKLVCNVTGFPKPTVTWKHGNKLLHTSGNIMIVHNVTNTTAGYYTCIATNDVGTSQVNIFLEVTYDTPKIVTPPRTAFVMVGQSHSFTCIATGHPKPSLTWSFKTFAQESTSMPSHQLHQNGQELTLFPLKTLESGTLTCAAVNAFGVDRASVAVVIKNPGTTGFG